jgi:hypothetical protein
MNIPGSWFSHALLSKWIGKIGDEVLTDKTTVLFCPPTSPGF